MGSTLFPFGEMFYIKPNNSIYLLGGFYTWSVMRLLSDGKKNRSKCPPKRFQDGYKSDQTPSGGGLGRISDETGQV